MSVVIEWVPGGEGVGTAQAGFWQVWAATNPARPGYTPFSWDAYMGPAQITPMSCACCSADLTPQITRWGVF